VSFERGASAFKDYMSRKIFIEDDSFASMAERPS
jgi:hypothetical protein